MDGSLGTLPTESSSPGEGFVKAPVAVQAPGIMQHMHAAGGSGSHLELQVELSTTLQSHAAAVLIGAFARGRSARRLAAQRIKANAMLTTAVRWKQAVSFASRQSRVRHHVPGA